MSESANTPTVILVHGGFADASFWVPVIKELQAHDLPVLAPPNPLRGLAHDAEYIASYVNQIDGPALLAGHSYGGAVISVAGASTPNAVGLVFVAAFALDEGESFAEIFAQFGDTPGHLRHARLCRVGRPGAAGAAGVRRIEPSPRSVAARRADRPGSADRLPCRRRAVQPGDRAEAIRLTADGEHAPLPHLSQARNQCTKPARRGSIGNPVGRRRRAPPPPARDRFRPAAPAAPPPAPAADRPRQRASRDAGGVSETHEHHEVTRPERSWWVGASR
jgi:pimeloyl-ACP methyl ester carboxylesterase